MSNKGTPSITVNGWSGNFWYQERVAGVFDAFVKFGQDDRIHAGTFRSDREDDRLVYTLDDGRIVTEARQAAYTLAYEAAQRIYK